MLGVFAQEQNHAHKDCEQVNGKVSCNRTVEDYVVYRSLQNGTFSQDVGTAKDSSIDCSDKIKYTESNGNITQVGKIDANICTLLEKSTLSVVPATIQVGNSTHLLHPMSMGGGIKSSSGSNFPTIKVENEFFDHIANDQLDHIVLKERQRILLSRCYFLVI